MVGPLELAANGLMALAVLLAGRNSVHSWWTGIIGCVLFGWLFYDTHLYADVMLQLFFIVTNLLGWWHWIRGNQGKPVPVSHANFASLAWTVPVGMVATAAYGAMLHYYTNAYAPFLDSTVLVFSIIAQVLLIQRRIENWAFWLLVNSIGAPLYFSRGLYLTAALYTGFWINAILSWLWWRELARRAAPVNP
ncbi:MAG: nicotinamide riboside transporter PnuC [Pseudomonadota bacterium]